MNGPSKTAIGGVLAVAALGIGAGAAVAAGPPAQAADQAPFVCVAPQGGGAYVRLADGTPRGNLEFPTKDCR